MKQIIKWINENGTFINTLSACVSVFFSGTAIVISVLSARKIDKNEQYHERYSVYISFMKLLSISEIISHESITSKFKITMCNVLMGGQFSENAEIGAEIVALNNELEKTPKDSEDYHAIQDERKAKVLKKLQLDEKGYQETKEILNKAKLFYSKKICCMINELLTAYGELIMVINYSDENAVSASCERLNAACEKIKKLKIVEKMEQKISFR